MSPMAAGGWIAQRTIPTFIGGAEANVATALSGWNVPAGYCTAMPDNYLANDIRSYFQQMGIDVSSTHASGNRVGIYYLQQGADLKNAGVIYDRAHSSFYDLRLGMINWDEALEGVSWFHFSAISPALNEHAAAVCKEALKAATAKGITISVDLNYRAKLWQFGKRPVEVMPELAQYCDLIMGNIWAANTLLGIPLHDELIEQDSKQVYLEHSIRTSAAIMEKFPRCKSVANTFRFSKEDDSLDYYTTLYRADQLYVSPHFKTAAVLDKIGSGDCFMGGLIYGFYNQHEPQQIIDFAASAAFGKLNELGDATNQTVADVQTIIQQHARG